MVACIDHPQDSARGCRRKGCNLINPGCCATWDKMDSWPKKGSAKDSQWRVFADINVPIVRTLSSRKDDNYGYFHTTQRRQVLAQPIFRFTVITADCMLADEYCH
jgi:hypothetical protein